MFLQREIRTEIEKKQFEMIGNKKSFSLKQKIEYSETQCEGNCGFWNDEKIKKTRKNLTDQSW